MKNSFDDRQLELAAKNIVVGIAQESYMIPAENNNDNTVSIKVAKAKAGARKSINRTVRICAVAAVLMIGLVCAIFMGSENDEINLTKEAYLWRYKDLEYEGMPVKVYMDFKLYKENSTSSQYFGEIFITDANDNMLYEFCHIQLAIGKSANTPGGTLFVYHDESECPDGHKDENGNRIGQYGSIDFNKDKTEAVITIYEGASRIWIHDDSYERPQGKPLIITTSATNINDAIAVTESFYNFSE